MIHTQQHGLDVDRPRWTVLAGLGLAEYRAWSYRLVAQVNEGSGAQGLPSAPVHASVPTAAVTSLAMGHLGGVVAEVFVFATDLAWAQNGEGFEREIRHFYPNATVQRMGAGLAMHESNTGTVFHELVDVLRNARHVLLDLSTGPRQIQTLALAALRYETALRDGPANQLEVWIAQEPDIGVLGSGPAQEGVVSRLSDLYRVNGLAEAVNEFKRFGKGDRLAGIYAADARNLEEGSERSKAPVDAERARDARAAAEAVLSITDAVTNGLSMQVGAFDAETSFPSLSGHGDREADPSEPLLALMRKQLAPLCTPGLNDGEGPCLSISEMKRQVAFVRLAIQRRDVASGVRAITELMINRVLLEVMEMEQELELEPGVIARTWLDARGGGSTRGTAVDVLAGLRGPGQLGWMHESLREMRNRYAHAGFSTSSPESSSDKDPAGVSGDLVRLGECLTRFEDSQESCDAALRSRIKEVWTKRFKPKNATGELGTLGAVDEDPNAPGRSANGS